MKSKLLKKYFSEQQPHGHYRTILRNFVSTLGIDWDDISPKRLRKFANGKRYKDYKALTKIKRIVDKAHANEDFVYDNYEYFINEFIMDESDDITDEEIDCFLMLYESAPAKTKVHHFKYTWLPQNDLGYIQRDIERQQDLKTLTTPIKKGEVDAAPSIHEPTPLELRKQAVRRKSIKVLDSGGVVTKHGTVNYRGTENKVIGRNKIQFKTRKRLPSGEIDFHKTTQINPFVARVKTWTKNPLK